MFATLLNNFLKLTSFQFAYFFFLMRLDKKQRTTIKTVTKTTGTTTAIAISVHLILLLLPGTSRGGLDVVDNLGEVIMLLKVIPYVVDSSDHLVVTEVDWPILMVSKK